MTLTEFLKARCDEDERRALNIYALDSKHFWSNRALAEVEAKRRILARLERVQGGDTTEHAWHEQGLFEAVGFLALPYADHPDFDPEWKR